MLKTKIFLLCFIFSANIFAQNISLQDQFYSVVQNTSMNVQDKSKKIEELAKKAEKVKYAKLILMTADYFLEIRNYSKSRFYYRKAAKIALIKNKYLILFACGTRLVYLADRDEGEVYLYQAARRAMKNADWYLIVKVAKELIKIRRFKSADKWLYRAGYFARRRKSVNGLYIVSNTYKTMGYKFKQKADYFNQAAVKLEKMLKGVKYW